MPIYESKRFPESALAHALLDGLKGVEIGGAAHNAFGLDTINVDRVPMDHPDFKPYADEQKRLCGEVMPVDVVAPGDKLPFKDGAFDFVISSHVIEHFPDPIGALKEWMRVASRYVFIICPLRDALESDRDKPLSTAAELIDRHLNGNAPPPTDEHHSRWTVESFCQMCEWIFSFKEFSAWSVFTTENPDKKVGNGFTVVLKHAE